MKILGCKCRLECLLVALVLGFIMGSHLLGSSLTSEGFAALGYTMKDGVHSNTYKKVDSMHEKILEPTVPLAEGQLFFFGNNKFSQECCDSKKNPCGSTISGNGGCACMTSEQCKFLSRRGNNKSIVSPF